ncbi:uncharacterized protein LOC111612524 [Centruroides sculpturatus]|uniref:uncharacterized protein LOC111612524 n=1 Tax=Centruroides sculpturatus TaxID=218467 RepID=UPI000C6ED09E|nr:uncharacterized protein LOC111612524 [Centruroides sculpturatus]
MCLLLFFVVIFSLIRKKLMNISTELQLAISATRSFIDELTEKLWRIWQILEEMNEKWKTWFPLLYIFFVYETCFYIYIVLFVEIHTIFRIGIGIISIFLLTGTFIVSWSLSIFSSLIYDNYISIGKYSSSFTPEYRFKMICFMKRFGGRPFGISMWGFFYIKRTFLIRMTSGLYSVFSSLIQLTGVLDKKRCSMKSVKNFTLKNETSF